MQFVKRLGRLLVQTTMLAVLTGAAQAQNTYIFSGGDMSNPTNFFSPNNWQCQGALPCSFPAADDTARIGKTITGGYDIYGPRAIGAATVKDLFILHGSSLNFTNFTTTGTFNLGDLPTSTGTLASIGTGAVFNNNGTMSVITTTGGASVFSGVFTFFNNGTFNLNKLTVAGQTIVNQPSASVFIGDFTIGGGAWTFNNLGFLNKPSSPGTSVLTLVNFINSGTVEVGNGTLEIGAVGSTITSNCGRFSTISLSGILLLSAAVTANPCPIPPAPIVSSPGVQNDRNSFFFGPGKIRFGNNINFNGGDIHFGFRHPTTGQVTGGNVEFQSDTIGGNGNLRILANGLNPTVFDWLSGTMGGTGTFDIEQGGIVNINPPSFSSVGLNARTINNAGTIIWTGGGISNNTSAITFNNQLGGVFEARNNNNFFSTSTPQSVFINAGIFRKTTGTGVTGLSFVFNNTGLVDVQSGTLRFTSTAPNTNSFSGSFNIATGGIVELVSGTGGFDFVQGFNSTGGGAFRIGSGANATIKAPVSMSNLEIAGGTVNGTGTTNPVTLTGTSSLFDNGTLNSLRINIAGRLRSQNNFFFNNGSTLDNQGIFEAPHNTSLRQNAGAAFSFINAGIVYPGLAQTLGALFMDGNYTQTSGGSLNIDISGTTPGTQHDQLRVFAGTAAGTGTSNVSGTLNVNFVNGFVPTAGQFFQFLTCQNGCSGQFSNINIPSLPAGIVLIPGYGSNAASLITTTVTSNLQRPILSETVTIGNETTVRGSLGGLELLPPNTTYLITFYQDCGGANNNFGSRTVTTDNKGIALIDITFPFPIPPGASISARATDAANQTSVLSNCLLARGPANIQFSANSYTVGEASRVVINVTRSGDTSVHASVRYATSDGTATQSADYTFASGILIFLPGDTNLFFDVLINEDLRVEGPEILSLTLSNPDFGVVLGQTTATLTIEDNDTLAPSNGTAVAQLNNAQQGSAPDGGLAQGNILAGSGSGSLTLINNETQGSINLSFSNLSSAETEAHLHGPAHVEQNGSIMAALALGTVNNHVINLTPLQVQHLKAGLLYFDVHTVNFPNGEIRGQILFNPLESARYYVKQHYADFLSRQPDQSGFDFWTNQITLCGANLQCVDVKHINVSAAYFLSIEFQQTGYLVERTYKVAYGDATGTSTLGGPHQLPVPTVRYNEFMTDTQQIGQGVIVGQLGWEQVLENNKQNFAAEFVLRPRFATALPTTMTPAQLVDALNTNAGNVLSAAERTIAINLFAGANDTLNTTARAQALRQVAEDSDLNNAEFNRAFVLMQYFGYLRRNPNDPQDTDYTGYDFWLTKLNQFNGNFVNAEMVKAFTLSSEYRSRFAP